MQVKVLHIFAPNYEHRFGGAITRWKHNFINWDDPSIVHYVLDLKHRQPVEAKIAFNFSTKDELKETSRLERLIWIFQLFNQLRKHKNKYDILHFHVLMWGGLLMALWAKKCRIPAIYESVLFGEDTPGHILNEKFGKIKVALLKQFQAILANNASISIEYQKHGFLASQLHTLPNYVDTELFSPVKNFNEKALLRKKFNIPQDDVILLFVGSLIERKGIDILIPAFIGSAERGSNLTLWVVGPQNKYENSALDETLVSHIKQMIKESNLQDRVIFTGIIHDRQVLSDIYRTSDLFIFPSRKEGMPNVVLEAMASSLPVIVSDLPGLKNVVIDGENGIIVPIGDVKALTDAINQYTVNPQLSDRLAEEARRYILDNHQFSKWQSGLIDFYNKILLK